MKNQKKRKSGSRMRRVPLRERLYENWRNFIVQLYGNGGLVPTLDWRGCIGIDLVRWGGVAFEVTYMMAERGRIRDDQSGNFCFTPLEARIVFDRYHRLKRQFGRSGSRESGVPVHLRPETWTGREIQAWHERVGYLETPEWPKGRFTVTIRPGSNDLGVIKLNPLLLVKK